MCLDLEMHIAVFKSLMGKEVTWRKARNTSSPRRVILWPRCSHPAIRYLKLFPHTKTAEFIGFSADCLDRAGRKLLRLAASERFQMQTELGLFQCTHSFSITMSALFLVSQTLASLCANSVSSNRQELSCQ